MFLLKLEMHFLYKKYKIRKDWSLIYFVIRTNRSLPKFGKFGKIGALKSERLKHPCDPKMGTMVVLRILGQEAR